MRAFTLTILLLAIAATPALAAPDQGELPDWGIEFGWPNDGALLAPFDPGVGPYSASHKGIDVEASAGSEVRAVADGAVLWAGSVAGIAWVTVEHSPGLVSTVGAMDRLDVSTGGHVALGQVLGTTSADYHEGVPRLHVSMRWQGEYFDPLLVLPPPRLPEPSLLPGSGWEPDDIPEIPHYGPWDGEHRFGIVPDSPAATHPGWMFAPNANHVIGVAGLESMTGETPLVLEYLGYDPEDITYLSYEGRIVPSPLDPAGPHDDQLPYDGEDTWAGVAEGARRLRDQLRAQWAANPGQAVDLVGHSMGGLVILYYLATYHDPTDPTLPPIDHVATFASPIQGVGAATELQDVANSSQAWQLGLLADLGIGGPSSQAMEDVAEGSAVVAAIAEMWENHLQNWVAGPLANDVDIATFGGQWDFIVPEHASILDDRFHVVLPGGHDSMRESEAAFIALRAFLMDDPVPGESGGVGHWASYGIDQLGSLLVDFVFQPPTCFHCEL